jgi:hypothetical protein
MAPNSHTILTGDSTFSNSITFFTWVKFRVTSVPTGQMAAQNDFMSINIMVG